MQSNQMLKYML